MNKSDLTFKFLFKIGLPNIIRNNSKDSFSVLCLHQISNKRNAFFDPISPDIFKELINYLDKYYEFTTFSNLHSSSSNKPKLVLSFDDGYKDFVEYAFPILFERKIPCNHNFVNCCLENNELIWTQRLNNIFQTEQKNNQFVKKIETFLERKIEKNELIVKLNQEVFLKMLDQRYNEKINFIQELELISDKLIHEEMMSWEDLISIHKTGLIEVGSHTYNHDSLNSISEYKAEELNIVDSLNQLSTNLNSQINILSLPNGKMSKNTFEICKKNGVKYILGIADNRNLLSLLENNEPKIIDRIYLVNESFEKTVLRTELFHSKIKKNKCKITQLKKLIEQNLIC
jgi:peptidoglycan/xylan/chitin deacetylase (PgdA/CDA1 family)